MLGRTVAETVAEKLLADLRRLKDQHDEMTFSSDETFLLITGDVTHNCRWEEFDTALEFLRQLREGFRREFDGEELLPDHILCMPGNHDLLLQPYGMADARQPAYARAAAFKLFIESATEYAEYTRRFDPTNPSLRVRVSLPFEVEFVGVDTCRNITSYTGEGVENQPPMQVRRGYLTDDQIRGLETDNRHPHRIFRIGLMHHRLDDLATPEDEVTNALDRDEIHERLRNCGFGILLTGHGHRYTNKFVNRGDLPIEGPTGHSWPYGLRNNEDCAYQVLRLDPSLDMGAIRRCRGFLTKGYPIAERGSFGEAPGSAGAIPDLREVLSSSRDYRALLGVAPDDECARGARPGPL